jgi:hypothetical protein
MFHANIGIQAIGVGRYVCYDEFIILTRQNGFD